MSPRNVRQPGACDYFRGQFSAYIDGALNGLDMQAVSAHFDYCPDCNREFAALRSASASLAQLGRAPAPANLAQRIRTAISLERDREQRSFRHALRTLTQYSPAAQVRTLSQLWSDLVGPIVYRAAAGMASTAVLMAAGAMLFGSLSAPSALIADDGTYSGNTSPRFLYSSVQPQDLHLEHDSNILVQAYVNTQGHIYDYRIISGPNTPEIRSIINNRLLFSVYQPAQLFGQPVRGSVLISFAGVSVHG